MSRSVKLDYETLQNPGFMRKLEPKRVIVRRLTPEITMLKSPTWAVFHPDGYVWANFPSFNLAIPYANGLAEFLASGGVVA